MNKITKYDYPAGGASNETVATLDDGRKLSINTQYSVVMPLGDHAADCDQINKMGGRCTCGKLAGVDVDTLIADARINGKRGLPPRPDETAERKAQRLVGLAGLDKHGPGWCGKCQSYCFGDCDK